MLKTVLFLLVCTDCILSTESICKFSVLDTDFYFVTAKLRKKKLANFVISRVDFSIGRKLVVSLNYFLFWQTALSSTVFVGAVT